METKLEQMETVGQTLLAGPLAARMTLADGQLRPVLLICETVNVCNSDCVFCPYSLQTRERGTMSDATFEAVVSQYVDMRGGILSLTPMVGDILLDGRLMRRLDVLEDHRDTIATSVTTNLFALDRWSDDEIARLLRHLALLHVSIYGVTAEENAAITRRGHYPKFLANSRRLIRIWEDVGRPCELKLGFRNIYDHHPERLNAFVDDVFGLRLPYHPTHVYCNWGNSMSGTLPGDAAWVAARENSSACILLATAMMVFFDGRVSACACCDYDASDQLVLGNVAEQTLTSLFNGYAALELWQKHLSGNLPTICKRCTFHTPLSEGPALQTLARDPMTFIGG